MTDADFWKRRYRHAWNTASRREQVIMERIREATGRAVVPTGLGAGSTAYLPGTAQSRGYERGGADLQVVDSNVYLEVTGPQSPHVLSTAPLWLRPDKIANARAHHPAHETWLVHWLERDGTLRVIHLDDAFFGAVDQRTLRTVTPAIRGTPETYVEIPARHPLVQPWDVLVERIKHLGNE